jgi:hypothetical protein
VAALDKAILVRRKQLGGSVKPRGFTPTGKTPSPTSPERDAELLLPGKTEEAVRKIYVNRRAKAEKKKDQAMMARLDKALPVRIQRLKTQGANVMKMSPDRLIPGTTIDQIENEYKKRRAAAVQKKRQALVAALDKAIIARRKQFGKSPKGVSPVRASPKQKSSSLPGSWRAVFTGVDQKNPRAVSEKYQKLRKERPDDTMKLNALFKQAIEDIKKEKREAIAKEDKVKADKVRDEAKKTEQKQKDLDRQIIKTKRRLKKVGQSEQKAASNVQRFTKERDIAAQRRNTRSVQKLTRVAQKRQQNFVRARDSKQKLIGELRKLEQQKGSVSKLPLAPPSSPLKLLGLPSSPKPVSPKMSPLKLLGPSKSPKMSPKPATPLAREAERAKQKTMQMAKQRAQAEIKQRSDAAKKQKAAQQAMMKQRAAQAAMMKRAKSMKLRRPMMKRR